MSNLLNAWSVVDGSSLSSVKDGLIRVQIAGADKVGGVDSSIKVSLGSEVLLSKNQLESWQGFVYGYNSVYSCTDPVVTVECTGIKPNIPDTSSFHYRAVVRDRSGSFTVIDEVRFRYDLEQGTASFSFPIATNFQYIVNYMIPEEIYLIPSL